MSSPVSLYNVDTITGEGFIIERVIRFNRDEQKAILLAELPEPKKHLRQASPFACVILS